MGSRDPLPRVPHAMLLRALATAVHAIARLVCGLLDALPDQFDASTRRSGGNAILQLVAGDGEGPFLGGAVPVGIGAGLDVERESLVLLVHGVLAEMRDAARDDGLIFFRRSLGAVVRSEFRQAGARDVDGIAAVGSENQRAPRVGAEGRSFLAGCVDGVV